MTSSHPLIAVYPGTFDAMTLGQRMWCAAPRKCSIG
jgi:hypothetical protein